MQTITVQSVTPRDGTRPWKIMDGKVEYVTWEDADGELLQSLEGQDVEVVVERRMKGNFVNRVITEVHPPPTQFYEGEMAPAHREGEPNINTAKQIVIIRQNAWSQTNELYRTALAFLKETEREITAENLEVAVNALLPGMTMTAKAIEKTIRLFWFPPDEIEEIPF